MPGGQAWPKDKNGRDWPKDRWGRPMRPLWDDPPGVRAPGEGVAPGEPGSISEADAINAYLRAEAMFADPVGMARAALVPPDPANLYAYAHDQPLHIIGRTGLDDGDGRGGDGGGDSGVGQSSTMAPDSNQSQTTTPDPTQPAATTPPDPTTPSPDPSIQQEPVAPLPGVVSVRKESSHFQSDSVAPAQAGVQASRDGAAGLDCRFRGNDEEGTAR
jgi:hypothetical protein